MNKDSKNIDQLFQQGLRGFKEKAPAHAWERLNADLNSQKQKKALFYFRWTAAAIFLLIAFGAGYFYADYKINNKLELMVKDEASSDITNKAANQSESNEQSEFELKKNSDLGPSANTSESKLTSTISQSERTISRIIPDKSQIEPNHETLLADNNIETNPVTEATVYSTGNTELSFAKDSIGLFPNNDIDREEISQASGNSLTELKIDPKTQFYTEDNFLLPKENKGSYKWAIGAQLATVVSYRDISTTYSNGQPTGVDPESDMNNKENKLVAYAGGIDVNYSFSDRWSMQSGLYFSRIGQENTSAMEFQQLKINEYVLVSITTSTGKISFEIENIPNEINSGEVYKDTIGTPGTESIKVIQNFDLFEIPLLIRYKIINRRLGVSFSGGISPAYLLKNSNYLEFNDERYDLGNVDNLNTMIFNSTMALGIEFGLSEKLAFNLEPTFKYSLSPINNSSEFNYHPYYFSMFTGIRYKF